MRDSDLPASSSRSPLAPENPAADLPRRLRANESKASKSEAGESNAGKSKALKSKAGGSKTGFKRLAVRGVLFNFLGRAIGFLTAFILTPVLIHRLGDESYGVWTVLMSVGGYYALADIGLRSAAVKYVAQYAAQSDSAAINKLVSTAWAIYAGLAAVVMAVALTIAQWFPLWFRVPEPLAAAASWAVLIVGLTSAVRLVSQISAAVLQALQRHDFANGVAIAAQVLEAAGMIAVVSLGGGLVAMACVVLAVTCATQLAAYWLVSRRLSAFTLSWRYLDRDALRLLFGFSALTVMINSVRRLTQVSGALLVSALVGPAAVVAYVLAESLLGKVESLTKGVSSVTMPMASQLDSQSREADLRRLMSQTTRILFAVAVFAAVLFVTLGERLIDLWIKPGYGERSYSVLLILSASFVATMMSGGLPTLLMGMGRLKMLATRELLACGATFVLAFALAPSLGPAGMAWAVFIPRLVTCGWIIPQYCCRLLHYPYWRFAREAFLPGALANIPVLLTALACLGLFPPTQLWQLLAEGAIVAIVGGGMMFRLCLERSVQQELWSVVPFAPRFFGWQASRT